MPTAPDNTSYTVITRDDGTFAVEVTHPTEMPSFTYGFKTRMEAEDWIFDRMMKGESVLPSYAGTPDSVPGRGF